MPLPAIARLAASGPQDFRWRKRLPVTLACGALVLFSSPGFALDSPAPPTRALTAFQHDPGTQIELVAAEPLVFQPCAVAWDADGRMFVAENRDYPIGPAPGQPPGGAITRLDDTDGDGRMDRRTVFADGLSFPNGLTPWADGFIVTCAPDILFLKDTDGDGRADVRRVWLTGFSTNGSTQLRVSHPTFGPDGWVYLTSGLTRPGRITSPEHPERPGVEIGTDARFNPFTLEIEAVGGRGQFGQTFDDAGNRFHCMNRVHIQHTVIPPRYLGRNPNFALADAVQNVPEAMVTDLLGGANQNFAARLYPISDNVTTADSHGGTFTAACGVHVYRGDALPSEYRGDVFACDPTANLVHRDRLTPVGPTFASHIANERREFLASADNWFRPVFLADGPDGALYVCDMYRKTIEHPDYLPVEVRKRTDFVTGRDLGRIWKVTGQTSNALRARPRSLARASTRELVAALGHANAWQRETAQRLLLERRAPETPALLARQFAAPGDQKLKRREEILLRSGWAGLRDDAKPGDALRKLHALRTLACLCQADESGARQLLLDCLRAAAISSAPILRENAWRLMAEQSWSRAAIPAQLLPVCASDPNPRARFWLALSCGAESSGVQGANHLEVLAQLGIRDGSDRWMRAAILCGLNPTARQARQLAQWLVRHPEPPASVAFWSDLGRVLGAETLAEPSPAPANAQRDATSADSATRSSISDLWAWLIAPPSPPSPWLLAALDGVLESARLRGKPARLPEELLARFASEAARLAQMPSETIATRKAAIGFLVNADPASACTALLPLLVATEPAELQAAAVRSLFSLPGEAAARELLQPGRWGTLPPNTRVVVLASVLSQPRHVRELLAALEAKQLPNNVLSGAQREALRRHGDAEIRARAQKLFAAGETGDRMAAYQKARAALDLKGDASNGRKVFSTHCASCHRLDREGHNVGPDLFGNRNQSKESILLHIVNPNYEVVPGFNACTIECQDGRELSGLIIGETPTSVTLRQAQGLEETLPRSGIRRLTVSSLSLMPEGLEAAMTLQQLADLLACLKGE